MAGSGWQTTQDPQRFLTAAGAFLSSRPVEHTLLLTVSDRLARRPPSPPARLGWCEERDETAAAFVATPPLPALVSELPPAAVEPFLALLTGGASRVVAVEAPSATAERLSAAWERRPGARFTVARRQRLHRLGTLAPPDPPPAGRAVLARAEHRDLLVAWSGAFHRELGLPARDAGAQVDDHLGDGGLWLWEATDGRPVAMAGRTRPLAGAVRVAPVYTPPEHRGRGFAAGVTAAVVAESLAAGAEHVLLFTDLADPVSNRLYGRLGFRGVEDRVSLVLVDDLGRA